MGGARLTATDVVFTYRTGSMRLDVPAFWATPGMHHIVGLNGSGKSTFLKILSGVLRPVQGQVVYRGAPIGRGDAFRAYCRDSGYLWQNFHLRGSTPTRAYLEYRAWLHGVSPSQTREIAIESLRAVGLLESADTAVNKLSGGMQRRVGIAAETLHRPHLLLLDEPSSGLDYHARELVYQGLDALIAADSTVITVAHEPEELARYDSTVHVMSGGRLAHTATFRAGEITGETLRELTEQAGQ